jgi:hypothetical protein
VGINALPPAQPRKCKPTNRTRRDGGAFLVRADTVRSKAGATARGCCVEQVEQAFESRQNRIRLSQAEIASAQWVVIFILAMLILLTIAMILRVLAV